MSEILVVLKINETYMQEKTEKNIKKQFSIQKRWI